MILLTSLHLFVTIVVFKVMATVHAFTITTLYQLPHHRSKSTCTTRPNKQHRYSKTINERVASVILRNKTSNISSHTYERQQDQQQHRRQHLQSLLGVVGAISGYVIIDGSCTNLANAEVLVDNTVDNALLFNPDGSLKDTERVVEAQERTIQLPSSLSVSSPNFVWVDGILSSATSHTSNPINNNIGNIAYTLQYNLPMKWDKNYIDNTNNERACTRISVYLVPYRNDEDTDLISATDNNSKKKGKFLSATTSKSNGSVSITNIIDALPEGDAQQLRQSLRSADLISGNIKKKQRTTNNNDSNSSQNTSQPTATTNVYSQFDLAVAPTTCSGGENEDLRLGFCPYDRIFLLSATTTSTNINGYYDSSTSENPAQNNNKYISVLILESSKSEWQRSNAELRRIRDSFLVVEN